jgi:uncharacterized protein (TIGR02594 family)
MTTVAWRQPAWLDHAWAELGQREIAGSASNPRIADYIRRVGRPDVADDATPWCAAFVGACLEAGGIAGTGSLLARSYLVWGVPVEAPQPGVVAVLSRGADPALGHVGFFVGLTGDRIMLLGGNQSDAVSVEGFARSRLLGFRLPGPQPDAAPPPPASGFDWSLARILEFEGGYTDDPFDPGGPTNKGVTLAVYAAFKGETLDGGSYERIKAELKRIPDPVVARIYRERYWQPAACARLPPALAHFHFDCAVNQGVGGAARMLQMALDVTVDGIIGPITLRAAEIEAVPDTLARYAEIRRRRYRSLRHFWRFGRGWLSRVDEAFAQSLRLHAERPAPPAESTDATPRPDAKLNPMENEPMPDSEQPAFPASETSGKWWGNSLTIWGTLVTAVATIAPGVLAVFGYSVSPGLIEQLGADVVTVVQAIVGLIGTVMTIVGRLRATAPLVRRSALLRD